MSDKRTRALVLLSGGLDSQLAVCVLAEQGIEVTGLTFTSPFFGAENARRCASSLHIELLVVDITDEQMALVKDPPHGLGKGMNPCIDCHALMVRKAGEIARRDGFDVVATGEVLGERPMSQNRQSLDIVAKASGIPDILLRPLSAKLLPPTAPEIGGKLDRSRLLDIQGRSRKPQMELAKKYGLKEFVQPAGGCLLTDPGFSARLKDLLEHVPQASLEDVTLLKCGRHFRLGPGLKVVVGRDEKDNEKILAAAKGRGTLIISDVIPGPVVFVPGKCSSSDEMAAAQMCASFSDNQGREVDMELISGEERRRIKANPRPRKDFDALRI